MRLKHLITGSLLTATLFLASCTSADFALKDLESTMGNLTMSLSTYDAQGHPVDRVEGTSFSVARDTRFDTTNSDGSSSNDSSVLSMTIGGAEMTHVGSAMVVAEEGLEDIAAEFPDTVDVATEDRGVPFIDRFVNDLRNEWNPKSKVVLVRSQQGHPLAVFSGDQVALGSTNIPNSTPLLVDGKLLILYRVDYTIYDTSLIEDSIDVKLGEEADTDLADE